jgi:hypothetical protein
VACIPYTWRCSAINVECGDFVPDETDFLRIGGKGKKKTNTVLVFYEKSYNRGYKVGNELNYRPLEVAIGLILLPI